MAKSASKELARIARELQTFGGADVRFKTYTGERRKVRTPMKRGDNLLDAACAVEKNIRRWKKKGLKAGQAKITSAKKGRSKLYFARSFTEV